MRRLLVLLLLVLGVTPVTAGPAWACSCAGSGGPADADLAFVGVVRSVRSTGAGQRVEFAVESVLKGTAGAVATVRTTGPDDASCGVEFGAGGRYRVYSARGWTSLCSGNEPLGAGLAAGGRRWDALRWSMILAAGSAVLLLVIGGEMWWLCRRQKLTTADPGAAHPARRRP
ncbi:hypothetical protein [Actinoplanes teichomyceticus]|uniref:hypothetical protein n=1 Tax=Actinoplanes teichomyceticus TaxID=1867 RepID=UPI0011A02D34|nr:hypothetical protein [Actinoplanes teichomyceticus]GIF11536.1 hypothetical protein Ate01nite_15680 [Actinoplanes teichomyceticus]